MKLTLDYNCIINLHDRTGEYDALRRLVDANNEQRCRIFVPAISASERTRDSSKPDYTRFRAIVDGLAIANVGEVLPLAYLNMAFVGHCLIAGDTLIAHEKRIHEVLFPRIEFLYRDYAARMGKSEAEHHKWENAKCDVQALWSHIHADNDVFVTEDRNFHKVTKKQRLIELGAKAICTPREARELL